MNINDPKIFDKKNEFNVEIENLLFILQICMNCTGSNENLIENNLKEFILANNYSQVILSLQRIEKLKLDIIQLINDCSVLKIWMYFLIQKKFKKILKRLIFEVSNQICKRK